MTCQLRGDREGRNPSDATATWKGHRRQAVGSKGRKQTLPQNPEPETGTEGSRGDEALKGNSESRAGAGSPEGGDSGIAHVPGLWLSSPAQDKRPPYSTGN